MSTFWPAYVKDQGHLNVHREHTRLVRIIMALTRMNKPNPTSCNHEAYLQSKYELKFLVACHHKNVTRPTLWIDRFIKDQGGAPKSIKYIANSVKSWHDKIKHLTNLLCGVVNLFRLCYWILWNKKPSIILGSFLLPKNQTATYYRPVHVLLSIFYLNFIKILSGFCPDFFWILSRFYQILF